MQLTRRELSMLDGSRRIADSRAPKIAYVLCLVLIVFSAISITWGVCDSVAYPDQLGGSNLLAQGVITAMFAGYTFITVYLIKTYGALIRKHQDQIDALKARKPPILAGQGAPTSHATDCT